MKRTAGWQGAGWMRPLCRLLTAISLCALASPALAAFSCSMSASDIAFGNADVTAGSAVSSSGLLTLTCTGVPNNKVIRMCVSIDGGSASDSTSRLMNGSGASQLRYQLYSDAGSTTPWGSWLSNIYGGGFTWDILGTTSTMTVMMPVHGQVLASQQTIPTGAYSSALSLFFTYNDKNNKTCPDPGKGSSTASFSASVAVTTNCSLIATNLNFGTSGTLSSNTDATSVISINCSNGAPYTVSLSAGNGGGATVTTRKMTSPDSNTIKYSIYRDSLRTLNWGNTIGTDTVSGTGTGSSQSVNVYGRVPAQTTPAPATYVDTIVVTATY
jgi:spore coat protein U-like protein